jgi:hypothetical protein
MSDGEVTMDKQSNDFYANAVSLASSIYDVTFVLKSQSPQLDQKGNLQLLNGEPVIIVSDEVVVRMSPQHSKSFAILLVKQILEYENNFQVKLPLTPDLQKLWEEIINK